MTTAMNAIFQEVPGSSRPSPDAAPEHGPPRLPLQVLAAVGERLAATATGLMNDGGDTVAELARLERWGLQLQALVQVVTRAPQLRHERVDLGLALLQTLAEWSAEADCCGAELHGPACSVDIDANPAALKHLLDLAVEHGLQQGRTLRLDIDDAPDSPHARVVMHADSAPATRSPARDTLAWQLLALLAAALDVPLERQVMPGGELLVMQLSKNPV